MIRFSSQASNLTITMTAWLKNQPYI